MQIPEGRQWIEIMMDKLIRVLGSLRRRSKWCLSVEMPEKRSLQVQGAFLLITVSMLCDITCPAAWGVLDSETATWLADQVALNNRESFLVLISAGGVKILRLKKFESNKRRVTYLF